MLLPRNCAKAFRRRKSTSARTRQPQRRRMKRTRTRGEAMRALTSIPVVRYAQFPVVPRRLGEGSSRPEGDLQVRRNEGLESERKRSSAAGAGSARSGRTFKLGRSGTLPDGTPREGWRGLPIRNAIQRACILRGRAAKRDNKLSHSKSLLLWSIRFRAWAPKSSNRVPEAATKSFTVREISTLSACVSETSGRFGRRRMDGFAAAQE